MVFFWRCEGRMALALVGGRGVSLALRLARQTGWTELDELGTVLTTLPSYIEKERKWTMPSG